jgi:hypothetical protein
VFDGSDRSAVFKGPLRVQRCRARRNGSSLIAVLNSFAPQLDLSFAAAVYGLVRLFLGSLIGELLMAALLPRHRLAR